MPDDRVVAFRQPGEIDDPLTEVLRQGARKLLAQAVEGEVAVFLEAYADLTTEDGRQRLVRHGHLPERTIQTGIGSVEVRQWFTPEPEGSVVQVRPPSKERRV